MTSEKNPCKRKCWNCGNVAMHTDDVTPDVCCQLCGSQDTRLVREKEPNVGPIYGVELIDTLPLGKGGMLQAMPNRDDLREIAGHHERVVAGYEVLLAHYVKLREFIRDRVADRSTMLTPKAGYHARRICLEAESILGMKKETQ